MPPKWFKEIDRVIYIGDSKVEKVETLELEPIIHANSKEDMERLKEVFNYGR